MSIKGFPSSQKLPLGTGITNEFVTVQPVDQYKYGLDITKNAFRVGSDTVPRTAAANTGNIEGMTWIYDTANPAKKGDFIRFETGSNAGLEVAIVKVETNRFLLAALLNSAPVAGDTYYIMRYSTQRVNTDGTSIVSIAPAPIEFVKTGVNTQVTWDQNDPNNTTPLPIRIFDINGEIFDTTTWLNIQDATNSIYTILGNAQGQRPVADSFSVVTATGHVVPVSATVLPLPTGAATSAAQTNGTQKTQIVDGSGNVIGSSNNSLHVHQPDSSTTGTITGTQSVSLALDGAGTMAVQLSGTWSGSISLQGSDDNINWYAVAGCALTSGGVASSFSVNNLIQVNVAGIAYFRVIGSTVSSGTATVNLRSNHASSGVVVTNPLVSGSNIIGRVGIDQTTDGTTNKVFVGNFPATQPVSGTVAVSNTFALDTTLTTTNTEIGALTETAPATDTASSGLNGRLQRVAQRLTSLIALLPTSIGQKNNAGSLSVALASDTTIPATLGRAKVAQLFNDYSVTSVTTAAYVQLTASTVSVTNKLEIFDSSGEVMILAVGAAASEVDQLYILPGGNGPVDLAIPSGSRISIKAKTATASVGLVAINLYS